MSLPNPHPKIDACISKEREFIPIKVDKCISKPADCSKLVAACVAGLLLLGGYGEFVGTLVCKSKLLLTETSLPISGITCCGSRLVCEYSSFTNSLFLEDQT